MGSGGLKANATSVVSTLCPGDDLRRDAGLSLFYLGINLGAFFRPILTGLMQTTMGFHWGFGLAAAGLVQYSFGRKKLPAETRAVPNPLPTSKYRLWIGTAIEAIVVITLLVLVGVIHTDNLAAIVIVVTIIAAVVHFVVIISSRKVYPTERKRVYAFVVSTAF